LIHRFLSTYHELEFDDDALTFSPRKVGTFGLKLMRGFANVEELALSNGRVQKEAILSFEKDRGMRFFRPPHVAITFFDPASMTKPRARLVQYFFFSRYYLSPSKQYFGLVEELQSLGIPEV